LSGSGVKFASAAASWVRHCRPELSGARTSAAGCIAWCAAALPEEDGTEQAASAQVNTMIANARNMAVLFGFDG